MMPEAYILPSSHIDAPKWNKCISNSQNGLIYASSDYLNAMADNWHGIVIDDYRAVMPIPWRIKMRFRYAYMPAFMQQLGLVGDYTMTDLEAVLRTLPDFVSLADIHFNFSNTALSSRKEVSAKTNLVIDLSDGYDTIYALYRKDLKENIRKAGQLSYENYTVEQARDLYRKQYAARMPHVSDVDYHHFSELCARFHQHDQCIVRCVQDEDATVLASAILLKDTRRIYNLANAVTPQGREKAANDFLLDRILHEFAGQPLIFDFEGSELRGVKAYYEKFGAVNQPYFYYHYNGLPWPLRLFKR